MSSPAAAAVHAADMAYGVLLLAARHRLEGARRDPFAGLALGCPGQLAVSVYLGVSAGPTAVAALLTAGRRGSSSRSTSPSSRRPPFRLDRHATVRVRGT